MRRLALALGSSLVALFAASEARADASAWLFAGGGVIGWRQGGGAYATNGTMLIDVGVGTSPDGAVIVGALFRVEPIFGTRRAPGYFLPVCECVYQPDNPTAHNGADLALLFRVATHGFQSGTLGFALDVGPYQRFWGVGSTGAMGGLTIGAPLGLELSVLGSYGTYNATAFGVVAGIDLLRLTVYRQTLLNVWTNPSPAQRKAGSGGAALVF